MYTTLESPAQPNYSLGPPYTNYSQPPYHNYRPYTSDILTTPPTYTGFHRTDNHPQPFAYEGLSKFGCHVWLRQAHLCICRPDKSAHQSVRCQWSGIQGGLWRYLCPLGCISRFAKYVGLAII